MKKQKISKLFCAKPILYFALPLFFLSFFVSNASARHDEIKVGWAANGIASSLHNLSTSGPMLANQRTGAGNAAITGRGTTEMCVYCHTPHFTDRGKGPLWNRNFSGGTVENYGTTIAKNNDSAGNTNMFSTIACLSCHDGVTTFDNIINQPGMGLGNVEGLADIKKWTFRMGDAIPAGSRKLDHFDSPQCPLCHNGSEGIFFESGYRRLIIGEQNNQGLTDKTDLTNDHPIGVIYRGAGDSSAQYC